MNELNTKMTTMEEKLEKVEKEIQRIGRREEKSKLDDGSDKFHDLSGEFEGKINEVLIKLDKVDQRNEDNTDSNTEELDEPAANDQEDLRRVKETSSITRMTWPRASQYSEEIWPMP